MYSCGRCDCNFVSVYVCGSGEDRWNRRVSDKFKMIRVIISSMAQIAPPIPGLYTDISGKGSPLVLVSNHYYYNCPLHTLLHRHPVLRSCAHCPPLVHHHPSSCSAVKRAAFGGPWTWIWNRPRSSPLCLAETAYGSFVNPFSFQYSEWQVVSGGVVSRGG